MTLGEGKRKVYKLIDEYSSGGAITEDKDIELKMADFFDIAQKDVAKRQRIVKLYELPLSEWQTSYAMPEDFASLYRVWVDGKRRDGLYRWKNGEIVVSGSPGTVEVEYFAYPATVDESTPDEHEFEVREDGAQAMCFYVAAQQLFVDLVVNYGALYQEYLRHLASLDTSILGGRAGNVRNTLWR